MAKKNHKKKSKIKALGSKKPKLLKVTQEQMEAFLSDIEKAALGSKNIEIAKFLIETNAWFTSELEQGRLTIARLRKLFQIQGSEKPSSRKPKDDPASSKNQSKGRKTNCSASDDLVNDEHDKRKGHGRNGADAYQGADIVDVAHPTLTAGDICPEEYCDGRLYEMSEPSVIIRVTGAPLASATRYQLQKLRCSICEVIYTAPKPEGVGEKKYDANFVSMLMINKYFISVPLYRQDRLQKHLGIPLPSSTQWDLMYAHKEMLQALYKAFQQDAANGRALCFDDTSAKVLNEIQAAKKAEPGKKKTHTCFTTGVVSVHEDHRTYLYMTDNDAAGKSMAYLLALRSPELELPLIMCDALSANIPQDISEDLYVLCFCLVHARRQFYELPNGYDDLADKVIGLIGDIYDVEAQTKQLSDDDRLAHHQKHSQPLMNELNTFLTAQSTEFEPNSVPGKAIAYILNRWTQLSQFLRYAQAPLDTNIVERALKLVIQVRKSSLFYKSLNSAAFASYVQTAIYSAAENDINPCHYMRALIENEADVIQRPKDYLPWHYQKTLKLNLEADAMPDS
jgi:transposase